MNQNDNKSIQDKFQNKIKTKNIKNTKIPLDFFNDIKHRFKKKAKSTYFFVPRCPVCGSFMTGRFFKEKKDQYTNDWIIKEGLKHGEIMAPVFEVDDSNNVFCLDCNTTWSYPVESTWFTLEEIENQRKMRCTRELLRDMENSNDEDNVSSKKEEKGLINGVRKYIGHI